MDKSNRRLPVLVWSPIPIDDSNYWYFYAHQVVTIFCGAFQMTTSDMIINGMLLQIGKQLDLLNHRFDSLTLQNNFNGINQENLLISKLVEHHIQICK